MDVSFFAGFLCGGFIIATLRLIMDLRAIAHEERQKRDLKWFWVGVSDKPSPPASGQ